MAIPSLWLVTNLTMYGTLLACIIIFNTSNGVESLTWDLLAEFYAQLVGLVA